MVEQIITTYYRVGVCWNAQATLRKWQNTESAPARAFSAENVSKARLQIINCRSRICYQLHNLRDICGSRQHQADQFCPSSFLISAGTF